MDPENLEKHRARATNRTLAVLTTFSEKFLKIFSRKNTFCVSSLFPREKVDSGGSESTKRVCDEKEHLFAPFRSEMKMSVWAYDFPGSNRPKVLKRAFCVFWPALTEKYPSGDFIIWAGRLSRDGRVPYLPEPAGPTWLIWFGGRGKWEPKSKAFFGENRLH